MNAFYDAGHDGVARLGIDNTNHERIGQVFSKKCHSVALEKGRMKAQKVPVRPAGEKSD